MTDTSGRMAGVPSKAWREKAHIPTKSNADGRLTVCGLGMFDRPNIAETPNDVTCETCERVYGAWEEREQTRDAELASLAAHGYPVALITDNATLDDLRRAHESVHRSGVLITPRMVEAWRDH